MDAELLTGDDLGERAGFAMAVPLAAALHVGLVDPGDPAVGAELRVGALASNGAGGLHSAALAALLELAGYLALAPHLTSAEHAVTHAISTSLVSGAADGEVVIARGGLDRRTKRLAFVSVVASVDERCVARSSLVKSIVPWPGA